MSKELNNKILTILKEICGNNYFRPTEFDPKTLELRTQSSVFDISHSLNNLQRDGYIKIHIGLPGQLNKVELLKEK